MNQIVTDNRDKISTRMSLCASALADHVEAIKTFRAERKQIEALPYIDAEKKRMLATAEKTLDETVQAQYKQIHSGLEEIQALALEMAQVHDIGADLQNALSVINALEQDLPNETRFALPRLFKGQRQALDLLYTAYKRAGIAPEEYFNGLMVAIETEVQKLDEMAYNMAVNPLATSHLLRAFTESAEKFADSLGVKLNSPFSETVDLRASYIEELRAVAGVGTAD